MISSGIPRVINMELVKNDKIELFFDEESSSVKVVAIDSMEIGRGGISFLKDLYIETAGGVMGVIYDHIPLTGIRNNIIPPYYKGFLTEPVIFSVVYDYQGAMITKHVASGEVIASLVFIPIGISFKHLSTILNNKDYRRSEIHIRIKPGISKEEEGVKRSVKVRAINFKYKTRDEIKKIIELKEEEKLKEAEEYIKNQIREKINKFSNNVFGHCLPNSIPPEVKEKLVNYVFENKLYLSPFNFPHKLATMHYGTLEFRYYIDKFFQNKKEAEEFVEKYHKKGAWRSFTWAILIEHEDKYYVGIVESIFS